MNSEELLSPAFKIYIYIYDTYLLVYVSSIYWQLYPKTTDIYHKSIFLIHLVYYIPV